MLLPSSAPSSLIRYIQIFLLYTTAPPRFDSPHGEIVHGFPGARLLEITHGLSWPVCARGFCLIHACNMTIKTKFSPGCAGQCIYLFPLLFLPALKILCSLDIMLVSTETDLLGKIISTGELVIRDCAAADCISGC